MTAKQSNQHSEIEYDFFCNALEKQYKQAKENGIFEVLKVLELDKEHSDYNLVQAIDYFNKNDGIVKKDAPMDFLTEREKSVVNQDEKFRPELYCMLLSQNFAEALENKSAFMQHSFKYTFDGK